MSGPSDGNAAPQHHYTGGSIEHTATTAASSSGCTPLWNAWYGPQTPLVIAFFGRLKRIPAAEWHRVAAADPHVGVRESTAATPPDPTAYLREAQADLVARAHLREAMDVTPGVARRIRTRIDQELAILDGIAAPAMVTRMRRAARLAACALAAKPLLPAEEFERLYRPLAEVIPPRTLAGR